MATREKQPWWTLDPRETFWCEITDRDDVGVDLHCPQTDENGKPFWSYQIIHKLSPGDLVFHYYTPEKAFVGASIVAGPVRESSIVWAAHGTVGRSKKQTRGSRPAWKLPLSGYIRAEQPLSLTLLQKDQARIRSWINAKKSGGSVMSPFQDYPGQLRACQGYLTKMPADFVSRWPQLGALAAKLGYTNQADASAEVIELAEARREGKGQGFASSPAIRRAVEMLAVNKAVDHFKGLGFNVQVKGKPYDLLCKTKSMTLHVEVKGTSTDGSAVLLTPNEVAFARTHKSDIALFVVSKIDIKLSTAGPTASGGEVAIKWPWDVDEGDLEPLGYSYTISQKS